MVTHSFTVKKFLLEADEEMIQLYNHLIVVFSNEAFGKLPDRIEIITLLEGEKYTFSPTMNNVTQGMMYLEYMKDLLQHPNDYSKTNSLTECRSCPFTHKCKDSLNSFRETKVQMRVICTDCIKKIDILLIFFREVQDEISSVILYYSMKGVKK